MIILDKPYVSDFLQQTIRTHELPLIQTETARALGFNGETYCLDEATAVHTARATLKPPIYTNSENAVGWIARHLAPFTDFLRQIGALTGVKNFPVHVEVRLDAAGQIQPIEVNPMRFGG